MIVQLRLRRGTTAEWSTANPLLAAGEPALDTTANVLKIGDGTLRWNALPIYANDPATFTAALAAAQDAQDGAETAQTGAQTALAAVQALGTTNDTAIASRVNDSASATRTALSAAYVLKANNPIHMEAEMGATGNGVANDTTPWVNALALAKSTGRPIYAQKSYLVDGDTLVIDQPVHIIGSGSPGSGGYGTMFRRTSGNMIRVESNFTMKDFFIYDSSGDNTRTGAALSFRTVFDATTGVLQRTAGFCRFDNVRISSATAGTTSAWERIIDADGSNGWLTGDNAHAPGGTLPPVRDVMFVGCLFFGGRTANDTIRLNRVAHIQFLGGIHDPAPATTVTNGITISADSTDVQFAGFEAIANLNTAGAKVSWAAGNLGANSGAALTIASTSTFTQIMCPINGTVTNNAPDTATVRVVSTLQNQPSITRWNGVLGSSPIRWGHSNTNYRNTLGAFSGGGYGFLGLNAEHSTTANMLKNDDAGVRGFAMLSNQIAAGSVSFVYADSATAGATWGALNTYEPLRINYSATIGGVDVGRTPTGNYLSLQGQVAGGGPRIVGTGADTNISPNFNGKGAGAISLNVESGAGTGGFRSGNGAGTVTFGVGSSGTITTLGGTAVQVRAGAGSPEGLITAVVGSIHLRTDGGAATSLYVKETGSGNTGWVAK